MLRNWFCRVQSEFSSYVLPFAGKPITYVEIGCWIGSSAHYVATNVLTHLESRGFGIDPYMPLRRKYRAEQVNEAMWQAHEKLDPLESDGRWTWIRKRSQDALREWNGNIDLLYVDGSHHAHDVLMDFCYAWPHLRQGSVVIFDDYAIGLKKRDWNGAPEVPGAVESILKSFTPFVSGQAGTWQYAMTVNKHPVPGDGYDEEPRCVA